MATPAKPQFLTGKGVPVPERKAFLPGPRGSKYPLETTPVDGFFAVVVKDAVKAGQLRSYLSALGKSRGLKAITRFFPEGLKGVEGFKDMPENTPFATQPTVVCWNKGERDD